MRERACERDRETRESKREREREKEREREREMTRARARVLQEILTILSILNDSGNLFDSSYERGKPLNYAAGTGRVIKVVCVCFCVCVCVSVRVCHGMKCCVIYCVSSKVVMCIAMLCT
jgi:hypothetical protein